MSKPIITEKLVKSSEIKLGNRLIMVEEYSTTPIKYSCA
jgi:hypothetical protein